MTDREKFEAWLTDGASDLSKMLLVDKFDSGGYTNNIARIKWEAWQAAIASQQPADDGWIEWAGNIDPMEEPVRGMVEVKFRNGSTDTGRAAKWYWAHDGDDADIIAYRVVKP